MLRNISNGDENGCLLLQRGHYKRAEENDNGFVPSGKDRRKGYGILFQLICMLVTNIFDIFGSYMNYRSTMDPFVFEVNIKATNVTDPVLIQQYQQELLDYLGPIEAVLTTIDLVDNNRIIGNSYFTD